ncbi:MAG: oligosaccharide flippase family protein [Thermotogae bacterium]|nr:oligosaccharide flippase family protein [Thermotogota bacterium]
MLRSILYLFSGNSISALLNLLASFLILKYLTASQYGSYAVAVDFVNMLTLIGGSFFVNALQRYSALYTASRDRGKLAGLLKLSLGYGLVVSTLVALGLLIFGEAVAVNILRGEEYALYLRLYALAVPFITLASYLASYMKGKGMFGRVGMFDLTLPTVLRVGVLGAGLPTFRGHGSVVATVSLVVKFLSNFLLNVLASWKSLVSDLMAEAEYAFGEWIRYSIFIWGRYALSVLSSNAKNVLVGALQGAAQGGVFKVAFLLLSPVYMLETSIVSVLFTRITGDIAKGRDVIPEVRRFAFYISSLELALGTLMVLLGPPILRFFGKGYEAASSLLATVLLAYVVNSASSTHKVFLLSKGRSDRIFIIHAVKATIALLGGYLLIRLFGTKGGVFAFLAEATAGTLLAYYFFGRFTRRAPLDLKIILSLAAAVATAVFIGL